MDDRLARVIYIRLRKHVRLQKGSAVCLGDIAQLLAPPETERELKQMVLEKPKEHDGNRMVIDMLQVIGKIRERYPRYSVEYIGEPHTLVEINDKERRPSIAAFIVVWLLLFFGSMLTIMNFHADVSMPEVMVRIVEMITGERDQHPYLFQGAYSIGIGLGMIVFFNHLFRKKWNEEPTPLEVEMFLYQENLDHYVITEEYKKIHHKKSEQGGS
ncbi:stage V sporulation protein AA [Paenibacillus sp. CAA11]|uniref:stage V sporulation protein AA n=1 Tax=Paenibacillus sp. CAA11 TaxID=1532905 RepID=UPI000D3D46CB|nr:stage V sporulation protein AA [Paenibacillus sp. CAA11]AWB45060.1 stage V sporulation protein AA [Paenibacillus sp. CAA11]